MRRTLLAFALTTLIAAPAMACGSPGTLKREVPPLAAALDELLPNANLTEAQLERVRVFRAEMERFAADNREAEARQIEEQAMLILGYTKAYPMCGRAAFWWLKPPSSPKPVS